VNLRSLRSLTPALTHLNPAFPTFSLQLPGETIDPFLPALRCSVAGHADVVVAQLGLYSMWGAVGDGNCSLREV